MDLAISVRAGVGMQLELERARDPQPAVRGKDAGDPDVEDVVGVLHAERRRLADIRVARERDEEGVGERERAFDVHVTPLSERDRGDPAERYLSLPARHVEL